jgi:hypothetical protein
MGEWEKERRKKDAKLARGTGLIYAMCRQTLLTHAGGIA